MNDPKDSGWLAVGKGVRVPRDELEFRFVRSSGPGGQHVNRAATAVQLRFDVEANASLPAEVKARLIRLAGTRITSEGTLVLRSEEHRSQYQNRKAVEARFAELLARAARAPEPRRPTKPHAAAKARRKRWKRAHSEKKRRRRYDPRRDD